MVQSVRAVFYVNNGMRNAHCVRYAHLTHVQLYHGDSDKAVMASPVVAMFDKILVAGQAAIDRYGAHGVRIPAEKFEIVGRPQVADISTVRRSAGESGERVVLYAPTWRGAYADVQHCSLPIAETFVRALLDRGVTVVLRPHPYVRRDRASAAQLERIEQLLAQDRARTGRRHRWGRETETELTLHDCMNLSDAMICDVSTTATEYLYSDKPFAVTDMTTADSRLIRSTAIEGGAYVLSADAGNLTEVLDDLLERDPLASARHRMRTYYLGDFPAEGYEEVFLTAAHRCLAAPATPAGAVDPVGDGPAAAEFEEPDAIAENELAEDALAGAQNRTTGP
jgi:hypothetical protein